MCYLSGLKEVTEHEGFVLYAKIECILDRFSDDRTSSMEVLTVVHTTECEIARIMLDEMMRNKLIYLGSYTLL